MQIEQLSSESATGMKCPKSGIEISFTDENITDYISDTFVLAVIASVCPDQCAIEGELNETWSSFYEEHSDTLDLDEMISAFPGPYKAIRYTNEGIACGPVSETVYYVVPIDSKIECI